MNQTASIALLAATASSILGVGVGFYLGKIRGMKLGIEARDFAESFGIGKQNVQADVGQSVPNWSNQYQQAQAQIHKMIGGGGGYGSAIAGVSGYIPPPGMTADQALEMIRQQEMQKQNIQALYPAALGQQKQKP